MSLDEIREWVRANKAKWETLINDVPISEHTLSAFSGGRYNPGPRLEKCLRREILRLMEQPEPLAGESGAEPDAEKKSAVG